MASARRGDQTVADAMTIQQERNSSSTDRWPTAVDENDEGHLRAIDIHRYPEKSKHLDIPWISFKDIKGYLFEYERISF